MGLHRRRMSEIPRGTRSSILQLRSAAKQPIPQRGAFAPVSHVGLPEQVWDYGAKQRCVSAASPQCESSRSVRVCPGLAGCGAGRPSWRSLPCLRLLLRLFPFRSGTLSRARLIKPDQPASPGARPLEEFLAGKPAVLARLKAQARAPLMDAVVNATRWALGEARRVEAPSGGRTKYNRAREGIPNTPSARPAAAGAAAMKTAIAESIAKRRSSRAHSPLRLPAAVSGSMEPPERTSGPHSCADPRTPI
jgi:hypothetical protein